MKTAEFKKGQSGCQSGRMNGLAHWLRFIRPSKIRPIKVLGHIRKTLLFVQKRCGHSRYHQIRHFGQYAFLLFGQFSSALFTFGLSL